ncbi:MAG: hypothetical protein LC791_14370 [Acidobacteria bacterium]|nr:hypothetical protein [Acidobacteriota bacterium]
MMFADPPSSGNQPVVTPKPPLWLVLACLLTAGASMAGAVYFGGTGRTPLAMVGTAVFVMLGGLAFDLARRRSA